jgi:hypothetical protein
MNEHIKELYQSCRSKEALASQDQYNSADVLIGSEVEKFAELIVLKCAGIADTAEPFLSSDLIKQHFGVKE